VIRSDEIRKRLCGVGPLVRLGPEGYTADVSRRVYDTVAGRAGAIVRAGHAAIVDAVFARQADRAAIEQVAVDAGVPFVGVWLDAPESILITRSERRRLDPSDAGDTVIRRQMSQDPGPIRWVRLDATPGIGKIVQNATAALHERLPDGIVRADS
jgi:uncharacterized protein